VSPDRLVEAINLPVVFGIALLGYLLGWLLNCIALVIVRRFHVREMLCMIFSNFVPLEWERADARQSLLTAYGKNAAEWDSVQAIGSFRYIVVRGGLTFGSFGAIFIHVIIPLVTSHRIELTSLPIWFAFWSLFGIALAGSRWLGLRRARRCKV
jgi:hypothetical protein